jgi:hypothetical protein
MPGSFLLAIDSVRCYNALSDLFCPSKRRDILFSRKAT